MSNLYHSFESTAQFNLLVQYVFQWSFLFLTPHLLLKIKNPFDYICNQYVGEEK